MWNNFVDRDQHVNHYSRLSPYVISTKMSVSVRWNILLTLHATLVLAFNAICHFLKLLILTQLYYYLSDMSSAMSYKQR